MEAVDRLIKVLSQSGNSQTKNYWSIPFRNPANLFVKFGWLQEDRETPASGIGEKQNWCRRTGLPPRVGDVTAIRTCGRTSYGAQQINLTSMTECN
jgi:hypothetical protein